MTDQRLRARRRAALTLHALAPADRGWVLAQIAPQDRQVLERLLGELVELGIPPEPRLLQRALDVSPTDRDPTDARTTIAAQPALRMRDILDGEPAGLVARVLASQPWGWTDEFLCGLEPGRRRRIADARHGPCAISPAFDQWLLDDLAGRLRERDGIAVGEQPRVDEPRPLARLRRRRDAHVDAVGGGGRG